MDGYWAKQTDYGADCYVTNIEKMAIQNLAVV